MVVDKTMNGTSARWLDVGSLKPDDASVPVWIRSKAIALVVKRMLASAVQSLAKSDQHLEPLNRTGLIISLEAPSGIRISTPFPTSAVLSVRCATRPRSIVHFTARSGTTWIGTPVIARPTPSSRISRLAEILAGSWAQSLALERLREIYVADYYYYYDEVISVTAMPAEPTFDFTMPLTNSYVLNGVVSRGATNR